MTFVCEGAKQRDQGRRAAGSSLVEGSSSTRNDGAIAARRRSRRRASRRQTGGTGRVPPAAAHRRPRARRARAPTPRRPAGPCSADRGDILLDGRHEELVVGVLEHEPTVRWTCARVDGVTGNSTTRTSPACGTRRPLRCSSRVDFPRRSRRRCRPTRRERNGSSRPAAPGCRPDTRNSIRAPREVVAHGRISALCVLRDEMLRERLVRARRDAIPSRRVLGDERFGGARARSGRLRSAPRARDGVLRGLPRASMARHFSSTRLVRLGQVDEVRHQQGEEMCSSRRRNAGVSRRRSAPAAQELRRSPPSKPRASIVKKDLLAPRRRAEAAGGSASVRTLLDARNGTV